MTFQGAVATEQGVTFAIVVVRWSVVNNPFESARVMASFQPYFRGLPLILMAQDGGGTPTYRGRRDIVDFLAHIPFHAIPWKEYTIS